MHLHSLEGQEQKNLVNMLEQNWSQHFSLSALKNTQTTLEVIEVKQGCINRSHDINSVIDTGYWGEAQFKMEKKEIIKCRLLKLKQEFDHGMKATVHRKLQRMIYTFIHAFFITHSIQQFH